VAELAQLQEKLNVSFKSANLLQTALTHSSYINENPGAFASSNERLELLGDAVLGLVMTEILFMEYPQCDEGELTRFRSVLVRKETLAEIAETIGLGEYLYLSKGEQLGDGRTKPANLAGAFEALLAAVYLDRGLRATKDLILRLFAARIHQRDYFKIETDYKSRFQEMMQAERQMTPSYHLVKAVGPDHAKQFTVEVRVGHTALGKGTGNSKKAAEMEAAKEALEKLSPNG
jgi:ribonuclease-3